MRPPRALGPCRLVWLHRLHGLLLLPSLAVLLLVSTASAKVPCETEGLSCEVELVAGTCAVDLDGELSCLADRERACEIAEPGAGCVVFEADEGTCTALGDRGANICVPIATDVRCNEAALGAICALEDRSPGICFPDGGLLDCVPDPDGCLIGGLEASCVTTEGLNGWCRDLSQDFEDVVCTVECDGAGSGNFCRNNAGDIGECRPEGEAGIIDCVLDPSTCPAEGDRCINFDGESDLCVVGEYEDLVCGDPGPCGRRCPDGPDGEPGRCAASGDGSSCTYGDPDDDGGCCLEGPQSMAMRSRHATPATSALGLLGLALLTRRKKLRGDTH